MAEIDLELVRHALTVARSHGFAEVELAAGSDRFSARLQPASNASRRTSSVAPEVTEPVLADLKSSLVGYYQPAPKPLEVGLPVKKGDVIAVVVALGIANDVESKVSGEVVEVLVNLNDPVEYGQVLARVNPS